MAKYRRQSNVNIVKAVAAMLLTFVMAAGVCCLGFASRGDDGVWFGNFANISDWHWSGKTEEKEPEGEDKPNEPETPDDKEPETPDDKEPEDPVVTYVDVQIMAYEKDESGAYTDNVTALTPNENNEVKYKYKQQKLAVPAVDGVSSDKYQIKYLKLNKDTDEYEEITEEVYLAGNTGTYKFVLTFTDTAFEQVKETPVTLVIEPQKVVIGG